MQLTSIASSLALCALASAQQDVPVYPDMPAGAPPRVANPDAEAKTPEEMKRYVETIPGSEVKFTMLAIPGGKFRLGSPESEKDRKPDECAPLEVEIAPLWMEEHETTWDEYRLFQFKLDIELRKAGKFEGQATDAWADAVSRPTPPYVPMDFGMGLEGFPAISMTEFAARHYTKWLSMKTGRFYRLPTEAEWEYACRAGSTSAYSFGDEVAKLGEHAWYYDNSDARYHKVKEKKPNAWGLYDMHGNVSEWCIDQHDDGSFFRAFEGKLARNPLNWPTKLYPRVVRGGSWDDDADRLRSAARRGSAAGWKVQDPQLPKSIWYLTDAKFVGFRVVRPLVEPSDEEKAKYWEADLDSVREILERQRKGGR